MNLDLDTRRWLLLAEKMLANQFIDECFEACHEVESLLIEMKKEGMYKHEYELYLKKVKNINRKLNILMVNKVRSKMELKF
jgi:hypothetical protein